VGIQGRVLCLARAPAVALAQVHHAGNELVVSAYRCVGVAGRNRKNAPRRTSSLRPVVTRHVQLSNPDFCIWLLKDDGQPFPISCRCSEGWVARRTFIEPQVQERIDGRGLEDPG